MSDGDFADHTIKFYKFGKQSRKWYRRILFHILELCIHNALIVESHEKKTQQEFPEDLIDWGQVAFPTVRYSDSWILRQFDIPTVRYSDSSIFRQLDKKCYFTLKYQKSWKISYSRIRKYFPATVY